MSAIGFGVGASFDAVGQYWQNGTIRTEQSLVAGVTGALGVNMLLRTPNQYLIYATPAAGAGAAATNTGFNNLFYGESTSIWAAGGLGGAFSAAGPIVGSGVQRFATPIITNTPRIPITGPAYIPSTPPRFTNVPQQVGTTVDNTVSNLPSFIPLDNGKQPSGVKP